MPVPAAMAARLVMLVAAWAAPVAALAQTYEIPPVADIARIPGFWPSGDNYTIKNPVRSDGMFRIYTLTTPYGDFSFLGDHMLRMRLTELAALQQLEKVSNSESYGKALLDAGLSPFKYAGRLITAPVKTVNDTVNGISTIFGRVGADLNNVGMTPGDPISGLIGVTDQRRKLATKLGIDPYTDFGPLDAKLSRLSEAAVAGGLTLTAAMMVVVPVTTLTIIYSNVGTVSTIEGVRVDELARDQTAAQLFDINRKQMRLMNVDDVMIEKLLTNRNYTPVDMTVIVASLDGMVGVEGKSIFLSRVAQIENRDAAFYMRRNAEMLRNEQKRGAGFARFVALGGYPFMMTRDSRVVGVMPIDVLSWSETTAAALRDSAADARRWTTTGQVELRITGTATPLARKELSALGWHVVENSRF